MYPQENRLKKIKDFDLITKHGMWVSGDLLSIKVLKLTDVAQENLPKMIKNGTTTEKEKWQNQLKIAVAIGLKIDKSAVKRNKLKRQIREIVRLIIKNDGFKTGYYLLIQPKKDCLNKDYAIISQKLTGLFQKAHLLK
jgi:ribonuclease P protein component